MELRSFHRKSDYAELQLTLSSMGVYEDGMELQEMREVFDVLHMSANESETSFLENDVQQALRESELEFMPNQIDRVLNSTMMSINTSLDSSPDMQANKMDVQADVHHAMDWSPPNKSLPRKRLASACIERDLASSLFKFEKRNEATASDVKHFCNLSIYNDKFDIPGSSKNLVQGNYFNALKDVDSTENSLTVSTSSLHEMHNAFLECRNNDSGLIECLTPSSGASLSNEQNNVSEPAISFHEIHGPISVRRIHDSGLNLSTETTNSAAVYNTDENGMSFLENSTYSAEHENETN